LQDCDHRKWLNEVRVVREETAKPKSIRKGTALIATGSLAAVPKKGNVSHVL
jgi:hypothetical protein